MSQQADLSECIAGGASESVKVGYHVVVNDKPCKIVEVNKSKPGKHGSAKLTFFGVCIFTDSKQQGTAQAHATVQVPQIKRLEYQLVDITEDGFLQLMDDKGELKEDLELPSGADQALGDELQERFEADEELNVTIINSCGLERVVGIKKSSTE